MSLAYPIRVTFFVCVCLIYVKEHATTKVSNGLVTTHLKQLNVKGHLDERQGSKFGLHGNNTGEAIPILGLLEARPSNAVYQSTIGGSLLHGSTRKSKKSRKGRRRQQERLSNRKSCPTQTVVSIKKTAQDIFDMTVDVHPFIIVGNREMDQMFYETFCDVEKCKCDGLRKRYSESRCHTTYTHVYGRIIKSGEAGWGFIKIRSGCACVLK